MMQGKDGAGGAVGTRAGPPRFARTAQQWAARAARGPVDSLQAVARRLSDALPLDRAAAVASEAASAMLDAPVVVTAVLDEAGRHLRAVHVKGVRHDSEPRLSTILAKAWEVLDGGRPDLHLPGEMSLAAMPIPPAGRRLGVMLVGREHDRRITADEQAYLTVLTALLGLALQRLRRERPAGSHLRVGDLHIDLGEQRVTVGDREARLTPSETRLLLFLAEEPGRARTRGEILGHLWHTDHVVDERSCDAHVSNLRRKIETDPSHPQRLVTVRSVGYALHPVSAV
jgi:DNA-binding winged helix-turn-helix (wHTH) protein